jgi:hypothetical protein
MCTFLVVGVVAASRWCNCTQLANFIAHELIFSTGGVMFRAFKILSLAAGVLFPAFNLDSGAVPPLYAALCWYIPPLVRHCPWAFGY